MTYCLGIVTKHGLIMASDSRTNAGYDQVNTCRKMHTFVQPGERAFAEGTAVADRVHRDVLDALPAEQREVLTGFVSGDGNIEHVRERVFEGAVYKYIGKKDLYRAREIVTQ